MLVLLFLFGDTVPKSHELEAIGLGVEAKEVASLTGAKEMLSLLWG